MHPVELLIVSRVLGAPQCASLTIHLDWPFLPRTGDTIAIAGYDGITAKSAYHDIGTGRVAVDCAYYGAETSDEADEHITELADALKVAEGATHFTVTEVSLCRR